VLATLSSFFGWLRRNRRIERNPCGNVHRPDAAPARDRTLTDNEIFGFWHACDDLGEPIGPRLKLLLLICPRPRAHLIRRRYSAAARASMRSTRAAQYLNSGIFPNGSSAGLVSKFAAAST
jgi:hypothetical protein